MNNTEQINLEQIQITTSNKVNKINQNNELNQKYFGKKKSCFLDINYIHMIILEILVILIVILNVILIVVMQKIQYKKRYIYL